MKHYRHIVLPVLAALISLLLSACGQSEAPGASTRSPEQIIATAVQGYLEEQGGSFVKAEVKLEQLEGDFARVQIISTDPEQPGGFTGFLQRIDDDWTVLIADPDLTPQEVQTLDVPESILPEGWVLPAVESLEQPAPGLSDVCLDPGDETLSWVDEALGFCLLYPASHTVVQLGSGNTEIVVGEVMNHIDPRISIIGEDLASRSLNQVVDDFLSGYEGFEIAQSNVTVGGQEAVLLDGVPGQDYYRVLFVIHDGLLYRLSVAPYDPGLENMAQAEQLYALAIDSFRFAEP